MSYFTDEIGKEEISIYGENHEEAYNCTNESSRNEKKNVSK